LILLVLFLFWNRKVQEGMDTSVTTTTQGYWTQKTNTAYPNTDGSTVVGTFENLSDADCKSQCLANSSCKGLTNYTTTSDSTCLLMSTTANDFNYIEDGQTAISYQLNLPPPGQTTETDGNWTISPGMGYSGTATDGSSYMLGGAIANSDASSCKTTCEQTEYCMGFLLDQTDPSGANCYLMSGFGPSYAYQTIDSYALSNSTTSDGWTALSNVVSGVTNISDTIPQSLDDCKQSCQGNTACKGFAYGPSYESVDSTSFGCYLKSDLNGTFLDSRYTMYTPAQTNPATLPRTTTRTLPTRPPTQPTLPTRPPTQPTLPTRPPTQPTIPTRPTQPILPPNQQSRTLPTRPPSTQTTPAPSTLPTTIMAAPAPVPTSATPVVNPVPASTLYDIIVNKLNDMNQSIQNSKPDCAKVPIPYTDPLNL
jgi:hypothetical protein